MCQKIRFDDLSYYSLTRKYALNDFLFLFFSCLINILLYGDPCPSSCQLSSPHMVGHQNPEINSQTAIKTRANIPLGANDKDVVQQRRL